MEGVWRLGAASVAFGTPSGTNPSGAMRRQLTPDCDTPDPSQRAVCPPQRGPRAADTVPKAALTRSLRFPTLPHRCAAFRTEGAMPCALIPLAFSSAAMPAGRGNSGLD